MKKIIFFFFSIAFVFNACASHSEVAQKPENPAIPAYILKKAERFISSRTGENFFKKNFAFDSLKSKKIKEGFFIRYNYTRAEYPFVNEPVYFIVDSTGKPLKEYGIVGIPDCLLNPESCIYQVDESKAKSIAAKEKLPKGVKPWGVSFRWAPQLSKYVWHIVVTTKELGKGKHYKAEGVELLIDPSDGTVLKKENWAIR